MGQRILELEQRVKTLETLLEEERTRGKANRALALDARSGLDHAVRANATIKGDLADTAALFNSVSAELKEANDFLAIREVELAGANSRLDELMPDGAFAVKLTLSEKARYEEALEKLRGMVDARQARIAELAAQDSRGRAQASEKIREMRAELDQRRRETLAEQSGLRSVLGNKLKEAQRKIKAQRKELRRLSPRVKPDVEHETTRCLDRAAELVCGDRAKAYGPPSVEFGKVAGLWSHYLGFDLDGRDVALCMILLKAVRDRAGRKPDNLIDIAGYAQCAAWVGDPEEEEKEEEVEAAPVGIHREHWAKVLAEQAWHDKTQEDYDDGEGFNFRREYPRRTDYVEEWWEERYLPKVKPSPIEHYPLERAPLTDLEKDEDEARGIRRPCPHADLEGGCPHVELRKESYNGETRIYCVTCGEAQ